MNKVANILAKNEGIEGMPTELQTVVYKNIMSLYDRAEDYIKVTNQYYDVPDAYVENLQILVKAIEKNAEIMLDNFFKHVETRKEFTNTQKLKVDNSIKDIKMAINKFLAKTGG